MLLPKVNVKKNDLLKHLVANQKKHKADIAEALKMRRQNIRAALLEAVNKIDSSKEYQPSDMIRFPMPQNRDHDYEKAIQMVKMTTDDVIQLDQNQFEMLVMDQWGWKSELISTSALYGKFIE